MTSGTTQQWHLNNTGQNLKDPSNPTDPNLFGTPDADMDVDLAWDLVPGGGSPNVIIALIDYGIMPNHVDIVGNLWVNLGELGTPAGADNDMNGCVDDINGCSFLIDPNCDPNVCGNICNPNFCGNITQDVPNHGHAVMGVMGARGNNGRGISGVMRTTSVMVLKFQNGPLTGAINAIEYGTLMGADIMNASWTVLTPCTEPCAPALREAIEDALEHEITFVTAAGNHASNVDSGDPNNPPRYPCSYDLANVICVANTDQDDILSTSSNWGSVSVDLAGTGNNIWTLKIYDPNFPESLIHPRYTRVTGGGTSLASPAVAGIVGLIRSKSPDIPVQLIRSQILDPNSIDALPDLHPTTGAHPVVTGGRANAYKTLVDHDPNAPTAISNVSASGSGSGSITIGWTSTGDDGSVGAATLYQVRTSTSTITTQNWLSAKRAGNQPVPASSAGVPQSMTVANLNPNTTYFVGLRAFDEWGNGPLSNVTSCKTQGPCTTSFCLSEMRCTYTGTGGCNGCCGYACAVDPTCVDPVPCPENACPGVPCF